MRGLCQLSFCMVLATMDAFLVIATLVGYGFGLTDNFLAGILVPLFVSTPLLLVLSLGCLHKVVPLLGDHMVACQQVGRDLSDVSGRWIALYAFFGLLALVSSSAVGGTTATTLASFAMLQDDSVWVRSGDLKVVTRPELKYAPSSGCTDEHVVGVARLGFVGATDDSITADDDAAGFQTSYLTVVARTRSCDDDDDDRRRRRRRRRLAPAVGWDGWKPGNASQWEHEEWGGEEEEEDGMRGRELVCTCTHSVDELEDMIESVLVKGTRLAPEVARQSKLHETITISSQEEGVGNDAGSSDVVATTHEIRKEAGWPKPDAYLAFEFTRTSVKKQYDDAVAVRAGFIYAVTAAAVLVPLLCSFHSCFTNSKRQNARLPHVRLIRTISSSTGITRGAKTLGFGPPKGHPDDSLPEEDKNPVYGAGAGVASSRGAGAAAATSHKPSSTPPPPAPAPPYAPPSPPATTVHHYGPGKYDQLAL